MGFSVLRAEAILDFPGNFQLDQLSASVRLAGPILSKSTLHFSIRSSLLFILSSYTFYLSPDSTFLLFLNHLSLLPLLLSPSPPSPLLSSLITPDS